MVEDARFTASPSFPTVEEASNSLPKRKNELNRLKNLGDDYNFPMNWMDVIVATIERIR